MPTRWSHQAWPRAWPRRSPPISPAATRSTPMGDLLQKTTLPGTFPGLAQAVNGAELAYLDNAATTHMPLAVLEAMREFETTSPANIHRGAHNPSQRATDAYERAREGLKRFIGAGPAHELV